MNLSLRPNLMYQLENYNYPITKDLIAQYPLKKRSDSKMMFCSDGLIEDKRIQDLPSLLRENDVLVINTSKTIKARLFANRRTGARVEILFQSQIDDNQFNAITKSNRPIKKGDELFINSDSTILKNRVHLIALKKDKNGSVEFKSEIPIKQIIAEFGKSPLPPYITREANEFDLKRYQTIYAKEGQSIACPTAGLHFDQDLLNKIKQKGVDIIDISLDVGSGTFKPVTSENINDHQMHSESYQINQKNAKKLNQAITKKSTNTHKRTKPRIIAIGSTSTRTLESNFLTHQKIVTGEFSTNLFIKPNFNFQVIDAMLTNFHIPKSTLVIMVASFMGYDQWKKAYQSAIDSDYRFLSYGDCMFIER